MPSPKFSLAFVYRSPTLGDCTNGGVSATHDQIYILNPNGNLEQKDLDPSLLFRPEERGPGYVALVPLYPASKGAGPMYGGNLATMGSNTYKIHDRFEDQQHN